MGNTLPALAPSPRFIWAQEKQLCTFASFCHQKSELGLGVKAIKYLYNLILRPLTLLDNLTRSGGPGQEQVFGNLCSHLSSLIPKYPSVYSVQSLSHVRFFATPWTVACQASLSTTNSCPSCPSSCPLSWWCHPTISSSVVHFSSCPQSFPASGSFPMNQLFTSGGQGTRASASVLPMNIQDWFP